MSEIPTIHDDGAVNFTPLNVASLPTIDPRYRRIYGALRSLATQAEQRRAQSGAIPTTTNELDALYPRATEYGLIDPRELCNRLSGAADALALMALDAQVCDDLTRIAQLAYTAGEVSWLRDQVEALVAVGEIGGNL